VTRDEAIAELEWIVKFELNDSDPEAELTVYQVRAAIEKLAAAVLAIVKDGGL
jgi:hypothetical protein